MQEKEVLENLEELEKRKKIRKFLIISIICVLFAIIIFLGVSFYLYFKSPERTLGLGAEIESFLISEDGKTAYIKLSGGSLEKDITKIKFLFYDSDGNEHVYETTEGIKEIEVPYSRSFWDWLFGRQFTGKYDYEINSEEIGLENFGNIENVSIILIYVEGGNPIETPVLDTQRTTTTRTTTTGGGSSSGGSSNTGGTTPTTSCTPESKETTCRTLVCGIKKNNCDEDVDCGSCESGEYCNATGQCEEIIIQTTNNITQWGITWTFDREYQYGKFVNGDYWIIGPVTIINITPSSLDLHEIGTATCISSNLSNCTEFILPYAAYCISNICEYKRTMNGAMINPNGDNDNNGDYSNTHGFDSLAGAFDSSLNVARPNGGDLNESNPLIIEVNNSLVSSKSFVDNKGSSAQLEDFAVLTVLSEAPPANSFRPAYASTDKTIKYNLVDINFEALRDLAVVGSNAPNLSTLVEWFKYPCLSIAHATRASEIGGNRYSAHDDYTERLGKAALLLNTNFTDAEKQTPLIHILQNGIDRYGVLAENAGGRIIWRGNGAWHMGIKLTIMATAKILGDNNMLSDVSSKSGDYWEDSSYGRQTWPNITLPPDLYYFSEDTDTVRVSSWDILTAPYPLMVTGQRTTTAGTVKVTNGNKTVIGVGTSFLDGKHANFGEIYNAACGNHTYGAWFAIPTDNQAFDSKGKPYDIADFVNDTEIILKEPYTGNTDQTGTLTYAISSVIYYGHGGNGVSNPPNCYRGVDFEEVNNSYLNWPDWVNFYIGGTARGLVPTLFNLGYRGNTGRNYGSQALPALIMGLKQDWNHDIFFDYTDRYVEWARDKGSEDFQDSFTRDMWNAYRNQFSCIWKADTEDEGAGGGFHYNCSNCLYNCLTSSYCGDEICNGEETSESCEWDCVEAGSLSPFTQLLNFLKSFLTPKNTNAILTGNAVNETNENGKENFKIPYILLSLLAVIILIIGVIIVKMRGNKKKKRRSSEKKLKR